MTQALTAVTFALLQVYILSILVVIIPAVVADLNISDGIESSADEVGYHVA